MTTLPDRSHFRKLLKILTSNVELAKAAASDLLSGKESTVYLGADGNLHRSEGFFKAIWKSSESVCKNSGVSRDVTF
jgi:hypothetical protein